MAGGSSLGKGVLHLKPLPPPLCAGLGAAAAAQPRPAVPAVVQGERAGEPLPEAEKGAQTLL